MLSRTQVMKILMFSTVWISLHINPGSSATFVLPNGKVTGVCHSLNQRVEALDKAVLAMPTYQKALVCREQNASKLLSCKKIDTSNWQTGQNKTVCSEMSNAYTSGKSIDIDTDDLTIKTVFHKRSDCSDTLIVVANGFNNLLEQFSPMLWMFPDADVAFFNFRGHREMPKNQSRIKANFSPKETTLGHKEKHEVKAVTNYYKTLRKDNPYTCVVGVGFCFGAAMMVRAQAENPRLFNRLILDSLWPQFSTLRDTFLKSTNLMISPQSTPSPFFQTLWKLFDFIPSSPIKNLLLFLERQALATMVFGKYIKQDYSIAEELKKVKVPILLTYGKSDALITQQDFQTLWSSITHKNKFAMITPHKHLLNFLKDRSLFKILSNQFIQKGIIGLVDLTQDTTSKLDQHAQKCQSLK